VGVLCGFGEEQELRDMGADLILSNTHELVKALNTEKLEP
jgi:phosphoglycolate phosphatase-like HAD superfamily hydrolase